MEKERKNFTEKSYEKLKNAIQEIVNEEDRKDVYVLSLCYTCDDEDLRFPKVTLSYNTLSNVKEESYNAASKEDAKWNYDYWLQTEIETIGGKKDLIFILTKKTTVLSRKTKSYMKRFSKKATDSLKNLSKR